MRCYIAMQCQMCEIRNDIRKEMFHPKAIQRENPIAGTDEEKAQLFAISITQQFTVSNMLDPQIEDMVQHTKQLIKQAQDTPENNLEPATINELQQIITQLSPRKAP